eukprot:TRINITY_DN24912_c0_g2_i1.p1 TRINITY_DN24912_c0_g2~~TRINITY_DN24912_c0_g2_i1.p1  ORF type:complete len:369 (-),score=60.76 TRINITY_DN24912_c0_g2_i1:88-1194(-)
MEILDPNWTANPNSDDATYTVFRTQILTLRVIGFLSFYDIHAVAGALSGPVIVCRTELLRRRKCVYVLGGSDGRGAFGDAERLALPNVVRNAAGGAWELLGADRRPCLNPGRSLACAGVIGGSLYVCGGWDGRDYHRSASRFDALSWPREWHELPPMAEPRGGAAGGVLWSRMYVCGGRQDVEPIDRVPRYLRCAEVFDPERGAWEALPPMSEVRCSAACGRVEGSLYVCGGSGANKRPLQSAERFNPARGEWEVIPPLQQPRSASSCAGLQGQLLVCGGLQGGTCLNSVEAFDPVRSVWSDFLSLSQPRAFAGAAVVAGRLFICGGFDGRNYAKSVEAYNPRSKSWEPVPDMAQRRACMAAVLLDLD